MPPRKKNTASLVAVLSLAEITNYSVAATADAFAIRVQVRQRAFVENGKLIHHLDQSKLRKGETVYGLLKARGVPEGSVQSARATADMIAMLVVPGHLPETRFDEIATFRIVRQGRRLLQGQAAIKMEADQVAAILATGTPDQIGAELDCLAEHGQTVAQRETALAEKAAAEAAEKEKAAALAAELAKAKADKEAIEKAAAELAAAVAADHAAAAPDEDPEEEEDPDEEEEESEESDADPTDDEDEDESEQDDEEEEEEQSAPEATAPAPAPITKLPARVSLGDVLAGIETAVNRAYDLTSPEDLAKVADYLAHAADDMRAAVSAITPVEAPARGPHNTKPLRKGRKFMGRWSALDRAAPVVL